MPKFEDKITKSLRNMYFNLMENCCFYTKILTLACPTAKWKRSFSPVRGEDRKHSRRNEFCDGTYGRIYRLSNITINQFYNNFVAQFSSQKWQITYSNQQNISYFKPILYVINRKSSLSFSVHNILFFTRKPSQKNYSNFSKIIKSERVQKTKFC